MPLFKAIKYFLFSSWNDTKYNGHHTSAMNINYLRSTPSWSYISQKSWSRFVFGYENVTLGVSFSLGPRLNERTGVSPSLYIFPHMDPLSSSNTQEKVPLTHPILLCSTIDLGWSFLLKFLISLCSYYRVCILCYR